MEKTLIKLIFYAGFLTYRLGGGTMIFYKVRVNPTFIFLPILYIPSVFNRDKCEIYSVSKMLLAVILNSIGKLKIVANVPIPAFNRVYA